MYLCAPLAYKDFLEPLSGCVRAPNVLVLEHSAMAPMLVYGTFVWQWYSSCDTKHHIFRNMVPTQSLMNRFLNGLERSLAGSPLVVLSLSVIKQVDDHFLVARRSQLDIPSVSPGQRIHVSTDIFDVYMVYASMPQ